MSKIKTNYGFTLLELMVVVIIIAVLAAVAVPQYQKAVLKSRFSTVMPIAKNIADAQEVYYLGRGYYAQDDEKDLLDVAPVTAENTTVTLSQTDGYDYVLTQRTDYPQLHYIMYQKHSPNYPSEIHCEAEDGNDHAQWLCGVLSNNNSIGQTITGGYTTYIINGTGAGIVPGADDNTLSCDSAESLGYTCNITENEDGTKVKKICQAVSSFNFCRTKTYNEDGSYTSVTCQTNEEGVCTKRMTMATYDTSGKLLFEDQCYDSGIDSEGNCTRYSPYRYETLYDENGNKIAYRYCYRASLNNDGTCTSYTGSGTYWEYDENGNLKSERYCSQVYSNGTCNKYGTTGNNDYTYDENGNKTSEISCQEVAKDGSCNTYREGHEWTYDENGHVVFWGVCKVGTDGKCSGKAENNTYEYIYDTDGKQIASLQCASFDEEGNCNKYSQGTYNIYDADGNNIATGSCMAVNADGSCSHKLFGMTERTYDANGNMLTSRNCQTMEADGTCIYYSDDVRYEYTYDANGNQISTRTCANVSSDGNCEKYSSSRYNLYDDEGKQLNYISCNTDPTSGECTGINTLFWYN